MTFVPKMTSNFWRSVWTFVKVRSKTLFYFTDFLLISTPCWLTSSKLHHWGHTNEGIDGNNADEESFVGQYTTPKELTETVLLIEDTLKKPLSLVNLIHQKEMKKVLIFAKSIENSHKVPFIYYASSSQWRKWLS